MKDFELRLKDGRRLAGALYGPPDGAPVFYFHGMPGTRREPANFVEPAATKLGLRIVALERPGYGRSDPLPGRRIADWAEDVREAADLLQIERFSIVGFSGGGAYALACAAKLGARVTSTVLVEALGPLDGPGSGLAALPRFHPQRLMLGLGARLDLVLRFFAWLIAVWGRRYPRSLLRRMSKSDQRVGERPEVVEWLSRGLFVEPFVQGSGGVVTELRLCCRPWELALSEIRTPVHVIQGEDDLNCPPPMGRAIAASVPGAQLTLVPDAGHLVLFERCEWIFRTFLPPVGTVASA